MLYAVCTVPVSPLRATDSHRSEMVSQLLLGECGEVLEERKDFIKLKTLYDDYEGWCQRSQLELMATVPGDQQSQVLVGDYTDRVLINGMEAHVPMGAVVIAPAGEELQLGHYKIRYQLASPWHAGTAVVSAEAITARAMRYLNTAYLWGGRSIFGIDCSGFSQSVFRFFNYKLLRDAYLQATQGDPIGFLQEARCGDLAFFDNDEGRITHVGIMLNPEEIIHASGKVRIDKIDNAGIIHAETGVRTHKLRMLRRYFERV
ncbi:C40 family peptidase [Pseudobacter ginsenosidimutans]|uniref:NlpC/P60 family protein n=1 Tax=Pseudobacter ginsenosidimutans TaxID=661488 RepID=A0A4Q7MED6_9BACT|nr:C40 family peptidase [Pseudobacter ginsenosidimutans]QEC42749.1 NlpC/P60 family protein [Pseudobacter ginsenosidimutans]RZS65092.1 NlpC/P60 family protein [Pseudobacter ginsenosidimutans]